MALPSLITFDVIPMYTVLQEGMNNPLVQRNPLVSNLYPLGT
jgi:hypothetical protein